MCVIYYEKIFIDNPSNKFELNKDDNLKDEIKIPEFRCALLMLMIQRYHYFV